jgi:exopolyphosphatase/guanosine-5'-triphosphate,3'-diphosphate pyrophosphatase
MQERYHVDRAQAERVENTAAAFLAQVEESWLLSDPTIELLLRWAARLHEIGLDVAHSGYHRHGAYLLANADMAGFPSEEQKPLPIRAGSPRPKRPPDVIRRRHNR